MGNASSSKMDTNNLNDKKPNDKNFNNLYEIIDYIATYYILTMDFKSLTKLSEKEYCDNLVVLTSDIIKRSFNDMDITYLEQRVKDGVEVNNLSKKDVMFVNKDQLEGLDVKNDPQKSIKKKRICIGIAKFYIKIAHIFAAIVTTINPIYMYKDENGNTVKNTLLEKDKIPKNVKRQLYKLNICDNRIRALQKGQSDQYKQLQKEKIINTNVNTDPSEINIQPKFCDINLTKEGIQKNLDDEPGISELMKLYLDDNYDYSTGIFTGMSESTQIQFKKDLKTFYTAFTGNQNMPPEIQKFSDIKLRDYNSEKNCQGSDPIFKKKYKINKNDELYINYAKNITSMIQSATNKQGELLSIINELFTYVIDENTKKKKIRVNPKLTDAFLQNLVEKTRKIIIELYIKCETDYINSIKMYESIVEKKIAESTAEQIKNLEKKSKQMINETINTIKTPVKSTNEIKPETTTPISSTPISISSKLEQNISDASKPNLSESLLEPPNLTQNISPPSFSPTTIH